MNFNFEEYNHIPNTGSKSYYGINVTQAQVFIAIRLAKELKEHGFKRVRIYYDTKAGVIKLEKSSKAVGTHRLEWQFIHAKLADQMPRGRYLVAEVGETKKGVIKSYILKRENHAQK